MAKMSVPATIDDAARAEATTRLGERTDSTCITCRRGHRRGCLKRSLSEGDIQRPTKYIRQDRQPVQALKTTGLKVGPHDSEYDEKDGDESGDESEEDPELRSYAKSAIRDDGDYWARLRTKALAALPEEVLQEAMAEAACVSGMQYWETRAYRKYLHRNDGSQTPIEDSDVEDDELDRLQARVNEMKRRKFAQQHREARDLQPAVADAGLRDVATAGETIAAVGQ